MLLKHLGYAVETASSGEEAVEYMDSNGADLVVLDIRYDYGSWNGRACDL